MTHFHIKEATVPLDKARALESYKERLLNLIAAASVVMALYH